MLRHVLHWLSDLPSIDRQTRRKALVLQGLLLALILAVLVVHNSLFTFLVIVTLLVVLVVQFWQIWQRGVADARANEARLLLAMDSGGMGSWDWDLRSGKIIWGGHHGEVMGIPAEQFDGRYESFARVIHPDDLPGLEAAVEQARLNQSPYQHEYRVLWPDGSTHWAAGRGRFFYDQRGQAVRMTGVLLDVTERKLAEAQLMRANAERDQLLERLQLVLEQMPIGCILSDAAFRITAWNPGAERIFGFTAAEMLGSLPDDTIMTPAIREQLPQIRAAISASEGSIQALSENCTRDGQLIACEWSNVPLHDEQKRFIGFLSMVQDVTERVQREAATRQSNVELERRVAERTAALDAKNHELEVFTYSVSHDLKAPLRGLDGYSRLLLEEYAPQLQGDGRMYVETIRRAAGQMGVLIDDLLSYSRLERRSFVQRPLDVEPTMRAVLGEYEDEIRRRMVVVTLELSAGQVYAEAEGLAQVLRNLLDNALKFTRDSAPPTLCVGGRLKAGRYLLSMRDNGSGFAMEYHDRIFEIFQRLHRSEDYPGTGVGLAIVRKAMERMGGQVWAESAPGAGACFYLSLPLAAEEQL